MDDIEVSEITSSSNGKEVSTSWGVEVVQSTLAWAYNSALSGIKGFGALDDFVASYVADNTDIEKAIDSLIGWQMGKAGTSGFLTGLGGLLTLPAAIPVNLASVLLIQLQMIMAIAKMRGYDPKSDQVRTLCYACLAGSAVTDILKDVGIKVGTKLTQQAIMSIAGSTLVRINQAVGFRLVTKAGSTGIFNLTKMIPFLGGIVGGTFDAATTNIIGQAAKRVFTPIKLNGEDGDSSVDPEPAPPPETTASEVVAP